MTDIVIIGGGASGMVAAIEAARLGVSVCILEKNDRVGRKLLATGNGRCNLTNRDLSFSHYHGSMVRLLPKVWQQFDENAVREFWQELGIEYVEGENGKLYPRSLQASSVLNALRRRMDDLGVQIMTETEVRSLRKGKTGYQLETAQGIMKAQSVIVCAGGKAYPKLGANGEGAKLAKSLKMRVTPLRPALCRLILDSPYLKRLSGVKVTMPASLIWDGEEQQRQVGEVLFTDTGVSGPSILNLSRLAGVGIKNEKNPLLCLDFIPEMEKGQLFVYLMDRLKRLGQWTVEDALEGWLPKKLIPVLLKEARLERTDLAGELRKPEIGRLVSVLKEWKLPITGLAGWEEAQVTVGGIAVEEVNERLESRTYKGLFFAGETLDLDGDCGGYNLHWAVISGLTAARAAAERIKGES